MFVAMNRFRVAKGSEVAFEQVWLSRDSHLDQVPGFVEFHLLKGPEADDHTLYASHTIWRDRAAFETACVRAEPFRKPGDTRRSALTAFLEKRKPDFARAVKSTAAV
jgi:heme-degrading monooxygenase HmoA